MKFGINFFPTVGPAEKPAGRHFDECLRLAELADRLGFHHIKTVEHYFTEYGGYSPDPVTFLAAAAARTHRVRLVTGAVLPAFTHPLKLAGQLAMLDNISKGRLDVGFGRAFLPDEFEAFEVSMDESRARFDEGVEACRRLWQEEDVVWEGRFHRFGPVTMLPRPYQQPHPRILVATAKTPASAQAAGRNGYGVMLVPSINKREQVQDMLALYRKSAVDAGFQPTDEDVHMSYSCYLSPDPQEARERGRAYSERANRALASAVASWRTTSSADYAGYEKIVDRVGHGDFDRQLSEGKALVGTPDEVRARLEDIREWFGEITVSLQVISGDMPYEESARSMTLFAEHVLPAFG
ncbi:alkanesulfonate monooxygenase SsuD/methylene tetrahydromethanopterin reductase-like flavin-dependent oxidoreductase (luciferase family) [Kitasatospora sp. MAA4]|uniref:LLM class flavin-dependent oxidoreductase n=1 Tax=Kitasatospora sp. MAA4 TaxID=3035093 RepID=UPI002475F41C|nr:LLM class flavin-dependent oxidoreductase [Kitasatospora sp. MAA4]MDH6132391.1 alkanesulfonate monooxygenase SsuD/methylene tetrahydromethanopterin reductase-like flavin-dependent oxidoreductase (luciferase family) [Kitasatospora sp. MAA4]